MQPKTWLLHCRDIQPGWLAVQARSPEQACAKVPATIVEEDPDNWKRFPDGDHPNVLFDVYEAEPGWDPLTADLQSLPDEILSARAALKGHYGLVPERSQAYQAEKERKMAGDEFTTDPLEQDEAAGYEGESLIDFAAARSHFRQNPGDLDAAVQYRKALIQELDDVTASVARLEVGLEQVRAEAEIQQAAGDADPDGALDE